MSFRARRKSCGQKKRRDEDTKEDEMKEERRKKKKEKTHINDNTEGKQLFLQVNFVVQVHVLSLNTKFAKKKGGRK